MNKFKVGDKVVVIDGEDKAFIYSKAGVVCKIIEVYSDDLNVEILESKTSRHIGLTKLVSKSRFKILSPKNESKSEKPTPLCYAEEQEKIQEELADKVDVIQESLNPEEFKGEVFYSEGKIRIDGEFNITQAKALKKWLTKMTSTPKKEIVSSKRLRKDFTDFKTKKVAKKKVIKKTKAVK